ncbi:hypothetical protein BSKO_01741 [Bryopsis sp. KO-2023]|nr:hypothetical protein BSKO_01741 [Bryopsis sp. KO-2023]
MRLLVGCLVLLFCVPPNRGFKEKEFKTCGDAAFCTRNRGVSNRTYALVENSIEVGATVVTGKLHNVDDDKFFVLTLSSVDGSFRLTVDEESPVKRYHVSEVLVPDPPKAGETWQSTKTADGVKLAKQDGSFVLLEYVPFKVSVGEGERVAMSLNARKMFHLEHHRERKDDDPAGWWEETFRSWTDSKPKGPQALSCDLSFHGFDHVYGIPERATSSSLAPTVVGDEKTEPYRLYNLDVFEYLTNHPFGLYGSIPFMQAHRKDLSVGVFWLNAAEMFIDVAKSEGNVDTQWISESGVIDLFFFMGPTPKDVVEQYSSLTGTSALPQLFSLGYHQCRWNYKDEKDVAQVDYNFDAHELPYDVLWLDIEHTDGKKYMTWNKNYFPTPRRMQDDLASRGRKMVTIVDPHMKRDSTYHLHKEAERLGYYVKTKDNKDFEGWCWPGSSSYLDVLNPEVRDWWAGFFTPGKYEGMGPSLYIWNDMNEPSVFTGPEITMEKTNIHYQGVEHRDIHNIYGYFYHMATMEGLMKRGTELQGADGDRPFVLSRAFFAGTQRIGPIWTGDNAANWEHLKISLPMVVTLGLSGLPFVGADVGGFFGNPNSELLIRWYQFGIFYPFFRAHAHLEAKRREPWLFGDESTERIKSALRTRYALLPYTYTRFRAANLTGEPVARPLWFDFPEDAMTFDMDGQMMFGPSILVVPVTEAGVASTPVYFPQTANWYDFWTGKSVEALSGKGTVVDVPVDMERIPVYYKGGSIVPRRDRPRRSTSAMARDPYTLIVALDNSGAAVGDLYIDDGQSFSFLRGSFLHRGFKFNSLRLDCYDASNGESSGFSSDLTFEKIVILGLPEPHKYKAKVVGSGEELTVLDGPLRKGSDSPNVAVIIRKPRLHVHKDWSVQLSI